VFQVIEHVIKLFHFSLINFYLYSPNINIYKNLNTIKKVKNGVKMLFFLGFYVSVFIFSYFSLVFS